MLIDQRRNLVRWLFVSVGSKKILLSLEWRDLLAELAPFVVIGPDGVVGTAFFSDAGEPGTILMSS
ncbi:MULTISPECIES: hypothetical protein [Pseudomonas]|jgi:hypothetical protein|uniref:hypothetical protein n=1 Tax=Pseudomonas TaxID=286 RepID=UPI0011B77E7F|nr:MULTISPECIES: hypothetical protein [Pseudomonas]MDW3716692.1 hypothetical protein [Pseudomonas sp. 2023EL-01195]